MTGLYRVCKQQLGSMVYRCTGRIPFSTGYHSFRTSYLERFIDNREFLDVFQEGGELPEGLGTGLDERVVEYPWVLSNLAAYKGKCRFLDAGSTLNNPMMLGHKLAQPHQWTILTLAPEPECFWYRGVSYVYDDLRMMPFRPDWFDAVFCISVIEHVGMDNTLYAKDPSYRQSETQNYLVAIDEIRRVIRPGGRLFLTVPFGRYENHTWLQQFDSAMLSKVVSTFGPQCANLSFFRYTPRGWRRATEDECSNLSYFDAHAERFSGTKKPAQDGDHAAAACGLACVELQK